MAQTTSSNPLAGLHKQKMYALIFAGITLISLFLPWASAKGMFGGSQNGLKGWGLLALIGVGGALAAIFMGDKTKPFEGQTKQIALGSFGAIGGAALIYLLRIMLGSKSFMGTKIKFSDVMSPGFGLFIALAMGALGVLFLLGMVKPPKSIDDKVDSLS